MACFLIPAAEAVITTAVTKVVKSKEKEEMAQAASSGATVEDGEKIKFSTKLSWLNQMLWGGSALLAFEHVWHGEIVPFFPFLTAIENGETAEMLAEMGSSGVLMAALVTAVWVGIVAVSSVIEKRGQEASEQAGEGASL